MAVMQMCHVSASGFPWKWAARCLVLLIFRQETLAYMSCKSECTPQCMEFSCVLQWTVSTVRSKNMTLSLFAFLSTVVTYWSTLLHFIWAKYSQANLAHNQSFSSSVTLFIEGTWRLLENLHCFPTCRNPPHLKQTSVIPGFYGDRFEIELILNVLHVGQETAALSLAAVAPAHCTWPTAESKTKTVVLGFVVAGWLCSTVSDCEGSVYRRSCFLCTRVHAFVCVASYVCLRMLQSMSACGFYSPGYPSIFSNGINVFFFFPQPDWLSSA